MKLNTNRPQKKKKYKCNIYIQLNFDSNNGLFVWSAYYPEYKTKNINCSKIFDLCLFVQLIIRPFTSSKKRIFSQAGNKQGARSFLTRNELIIACFSIIPCVKLGMSSFPNWPKIQPQVSSFMWDTLSCLSSKSFKNYFGYDDDDAENALGVNTTNLCFS
jgi:hypothetical protein